MGGMGCPHTRSWELAGGMCSRARLGGAGMVCPLPHLARNVMPDMHPHSCVFLPALPAAQGSTAAGGGGAARGSENQAVPRWLQQ